MAQYFLWAAIVMAGVVPWTAGCRKSESAPDDKPAVEQGPKRITRELPKLADPLPLLDDGRLEVAAPVGWKVSGRDKAYLTRFYRERSMPPYIVVTVDEVENPPLSTATEENLDQLAELVQQRLDRRLLENETLAEPIRRMIIGGRPWVRYVRKGRVRTEAGTRVNIESQVLKTMFDGRMYTITLRVYRGKLLRDRDAAYAVAAGIKFHKGGNNAALGAEDTGLE